MRWALVVVGAIALATLGWVLARTTPGAPATRTVDAYVTYYGWFDNTPPGCATAYAGCAGGTGTYADPITLASDREELAVGTRVYYPTLEKYFVMQDDCQECDGDWSGSGPDGGPHLRHVDLWLGGAHGSELRALDCEDALTRSSSTGAPVLTPIVVNAPSGLPVSSAPIFNAATGRCFGGATAPSDDGTYRNGATGLCLEDPRPAPRAVATAPCTEAADEDLQFQGAFLSRGGRCLEADGNGAGAVVGFTPCDGGTAQQWSINPDGTISWIQYAYCVADDAGTLRLAPCNGERDETWLYAPGAGR